MEAFHDGGRDIVDDALDGLLHARGGALRRLAHTGHTRVVLRAVIDARKVSVISGGGAGHEPLHAGLVGTGMLSAAVSGDVFASPSADAILAAIEATHGKGCVLIVKNYTGDVLNFRIAAARARAGGIEVEEVLVADDVGAGGKRRGRGVAGAALVHKVAACAAERGASIAEVAEAARAAAGAVVSVGAARGAVGTRIEKGSVEIGVGIHGEQGIETRELQGAQDVVDRMCALLAPHVDARARYAFVLNSMGGLSGLECYALYNAFRKTELYAQVDYSMAPVALCTSLTAPAFSLSLMKLDVAIESALLAPADTQCWPGFTRAAPPPPPIPHVPSAGAPPSAHARARGVLLAVLQACSAAQQTLDELDMRGGDGDTGSSVAAGAAHVCADVDELPMADPRLMLAAIGVIAARAMGGSLGAIIGVLCAATAEALPDGTVWVDDGSVWGDALNVGGMAVCDALGTNWGDRSIVDALAPAAEVWRGGASFADVAKAAREGADSTRDMAPRAGRAAGVPAAASSGVVDPGAEFAAIVFEALAKAMGEDNSASVE